MTTAMDMTMRWARSALVLMAILALGASAGASPARADGDPGSDVLVYQNLFVTSGAGVPVARQVELSNLLRDAGTRGFPIRVALIAHPSDLGAVTTLWHKPAAYAKFLGLELSLAYQQRLLVVMPNGFGFHWPKHPSAAADRALAGLRIGPGGGGLAAAAQAAVLTLAGHAGVHLNPGSTASAPASSPAPATASPPASRARTTDGMVALIVLAVAVLVGLGVAARALLRRHPRVRPQWGLLLAPAALLGAGLAALLTLGHSGPSPAQALADNPNLDPGTPLSAAAPDFRLSDQFGNPVALSAYRGKVVMLAFTDSECTTTCPMTTSAMLQARAMLGKAGNRVALLGVDANPASTSVEDVWSYSELHGMLRQWHFLTGSLPQLRQVWKDYAIEAQVQHGQIDHTPALFVIDPQGREAKVYMTQESYAAVGQFGQILAQEASRLLPDHPAVHSDLSYNSVPPINPSEQATLPRAGGGTVAVGGKGGPHLYAFFATWDQEITSLAGHLGALNGYTAAARREGLPPVTAIDEESVEASPGALNQFLSMVTQPLRYPVAIDSSGRVADGYQVQGVPWFVLTSANGKVLWYQDVSTSGWPSNADLVSHVRAALARQPASPLSTAAVARALRGSPAPLAALHRQAARVVGNYRGLQSRLGALRGYPVVINAWASWCTPCQAEFGLFANAAARYGRQVAFVGADTNDSAGTAQSFLDQHPVSYPSYEATAAQLSSLAAIGGLPTTIFINRSGKVAYVHIGQYSTQGTLDQDIAQYAR